VREKPWLSVSGLGGSNHTGAGEITISGVSDRVAYAFNQYHYENRGYRDNNDARYDVLSAYAKLQINEMLALLLSVTQNDENRGDIGEQMFLDTGRPTLNFEQRSTTTLLGVTFTPHPDLTVLATASYRDNDIEQLTQAATIGFSIDDTFSNNEHVINLELQGLLQRDDNTLVFGADWSETDRQTNIDTLLTIPPDPPAPLPEIRYDEVPRFTSGYAYWNQQAAATLRVTIGANYSEFSAASLNEDREIWSPKLAAVWEPAPQWQLRTAYFRTLKRAAEIDDTLEPSLLGGFIQLFDDKDGTESTQTALGVDFSGSDSIRVGAEAYARKLDVPLIGLSQRLDVDQTLLRAYANWMSRPFAAAAGYVLEDSSTNSDDASILNLPEDLKTERFPITLKYFTNDGFQFGIAATYVNQESRLADGMGGRRTGEASFSTIDISATQKLLNNHLELSVMANNLLDKNFTYQNTNLYDNTPHYQLFSPERTVLLRIKYLLN